MEKKSQRRRLGRRGALGISGVALAAGLVVVPALPAFATVAGPYSSLAACNAAKRQYQSDPGYRITLACWNNGGTWFFEYVYEW